MKLPRWLVSPFVEREPCSWCGRRLWFWQRAVDGWRREDGSIDLWHRRCREKWKAARNLRWPGWRAIPDDLRPIPMRSRFVYHWFSNANLEQDNKPAGAGLYALDRLHPPPRARPPIEPFVGTGEAAD